MGMNSGYDFFPESGNCCSGCIYGWSLNVPWGTAYLSTAASAFLPVSRFTAGAESFGASMRKAGEQA
jgi:hypothetical protein